MAQKMTEGVQETKNANVWLKALVVLVAALLALYGYDLFTSSREKSCAAVMLEDPGINTEVTATRWSFSAGCEVQYRYTVGDYRGGQRLEASWTSEELFRAIHLEEE